MPKEKKKKWMHPRHTVIRCAFGWALRLYARIFYGARVELYSRDIRGQYLILYNHVTGFDQFFVALSVLCPVYFVASEDLFSNGFVSRLLQYAVAPIPIKKQVTDPRAVVNCLRVAREGGTIAIAPEGNRTFSGRTGYMNPAIAALARKLGVPVLLLHIEDGYGVQPRWSDCVRRGRMRVFVSDVITPEECRALDNEALAERIREGLFVDEARPTGRFVHKKSAEYMERAFYVCPECGLSEFESHGDTVTCRHCGFALRMLPDKRLEGVGRESPFAYPADWYDFQSAFINRLDTREYVEQPLYTDRARFSEVIFYESKKLLCEDAQLRLYGDRIEVTADGEVTVYPFSELTTVTVLGRNKLNIYRDGRAFQFKGDRRFNALKYVQIYYRNHNQESDPNGEFLGL